MKKVKEKKQSYMHVYVYAYGYVYEKTFISKGNEGSEGTKKNIYAMAVDVAEAVAVAMDYLYL